MAGEWSVSTEKLRGSATMLDEKISQYDTQRTKLYTEVDSLKGTKWQGEARDVFVTKMDAYNKDFEELKKILTDFKNFLQDTAENYERTEQQIKEAAANLSAGL